MNKTLTALVIGAITISTISITSPVFAKNGGRDDDDNRGRGNSSVRIQDNSKKVEKKLLKDINFNFRLLEDNDRIRIRVPRGTNNANAQAFIAAVKQANTDFIAATRLARTNFLNAVKAARVAYLTPTSTPVNSAPTIVAAAIANPSVTTGTTSNLSVLGADNGGENNLTYTWNVISKPATATNPSLSINGTNAAKNTTATFSSTGTYQFQVKITDSSSLSVFSGLVTVTVNPVSTNAAPTVSTPATASLATVTGTNTNLSVLGADDGGENNLTYTWTTVNKPVSSTNPTFSVNGTNSAKNTVASFTSSGSYQFQVTITDTGLLSTTSLVNVTVNQTLSSVTVTPSSATLFVGSSTQFSASAFDQFNIGQPSLFSWSIFEGILGGSISGTGLYTASTTTGTFHVIGTSNVDTNKKATSTVIIN